MTIAERFTRVIERVAAAADRAGRDVKDVTVVAVAKTFGADAVAEAIAAGATDIGENRAQELRDKVAALGPRARWHFIGPLQTNKVRNVVGHVALVHSVERFGLAEAIGRRARSLGMTQDVLIEVNIGGEATKHGVEPPRTVAFAEEIASIEGITIAGLMAIPPVADESDARYFFKELAALRDHVVEVLPDAIHLSMGMTRDFEVAIEEGATIVRVGEAIFGPRR